ncbi:HINT domain-containing protein [Cardiobacteriaceae bacterium TAE3-ERU3]|nr:HINT domain-containing protein [Cardiobacteriaceae bacterium TAE3-ERU3]
MNADKIKNHHLINKQVVYSGDSCFVAGTLIETANGLKPVEQINLGELIWSREEFGDKYDYRPVIATKVTPDVPIYAVNVRHDNGLEETFNTTEEHPFWIDGIGWRKRKPSKLPSSSSQTSPSR